MAQKFGGKFSPDPSGKTASKNKPGRSGQRPSTGTATGPLHGKRPTRAGGRVNALFVASFIFAITAFMQPTIGLALDLAAFGVLLLGAWLTRQGELAHEAYDARTVARRPAIPRKLFGAVLTGAGICVGAYVPGGGLIAPTLLGAIGAGLHLGAFGPDPMRDKGMEGVDRFQTDRVARAVDDAERAIMAMREAVLRAGDRELLVRVDRFAATARGLFRSVENDPRDLTAARKYLSVYLHGARDATVRFVDIFVRNRSPDVRADYIALLDDLDTRFAERTEALMRNDRTDLDVEIEVLRERLAYESARGGRLS